MTIGNTIIDLEKKRLEELGYATNLTPFSVTIDKALTTLNLSNDSYVFMGIKVSGNELVDDGSLISIAAPTDYIQGTQQELSTLGTSRFRLFRSHAIVKVMGDNGYNENAEVKPVRLEFMKITPIKKNK